MTAPTIEEDLRYNESGYSDSTLLEWAKVIEDTINSMDNDENGNPANPRTIQTVSSASYEHTFNELECEFIDVRENKHYRIALDFTKQEGEDPNSLLLNLLDDDFITNTAVTSDPVEGGAAIRQALLEMLSEKFR